MRFLLLGFVVSLALTACRSTGRRSSPPTPTRLTETTVSPVTVPVDNAEKSWRKWVRANASGPGLVVPPSKASNLRLKVSSAVAAGGAQLIRLKVWRTSSPPPVELVVATSKPAAYLRHRLLPAANAAGNGYMYLEVVDSRGRKILERSMRSTEGMIFVKRRFLGCEPFAIVGLVSKVPACPAS